MLKFHFSPIALISTAIAIVFQGGNSPHANAFEIIPIQAVSTSLTSHQYFGLGNSYDAFSVRLSDSFGLSATTKLLEFTLSLTPPSGVSPSPPFPRILPIGGVDPSGDTNTSLKVPFGWRLSTISQISSNYCVTNSPWGQITVHQFQYPR